MSSWKSAPIHRLTVTPDKYRQTNNQGWQTGVQQTHTPGRPWSCC